MVNGRLRCLGSATHLKLRFGVGFEVNVRTVAPSEENLLLLVRGLIEAKALRPELFSSAARPADGGVAADALLLYMVVHMTAMSDKYEFFLICMQMFFWVGG